MRERVCTMSRGTTLYALFVFRLRPTREPQGELCAQLPQPSSGGLEAPGASRGELVAGPARSRLGLGVQGLPSLACCPRAQWLSTPHGWVLFQPPAPTGERTECSGTSAT